MNRRDALAVLGGQPVIRQARAVHDTMGEEEARAAAAVVRSGVLSDYDEAPGPGFMGGQRVKAFEAQAATHFGARHALAVNSWTSGLVCAVGALGLEAGDEIITTPWTSSADAAAILHWNCVPVFADIDAATFNLDPAAVERCITPRTRAILAADIFGLGADWPALRRIADAHGLMLLGDGAQAPGARLDGRHCQTLADIGGYSLGERSLVRCGEGGIVLTDDDRLAQRVAGIRNHAEGVARGGDAGALANMLGFNFRLGEIQAAIAALQLVRLDRRLECHHRALQLLNRGLSGLAGTRTPRVPSGHTHSATRYGMVIDPAAIGVPRAALVAALRAEGVPGLLEGYRNVHRLPVFAQRIACGSRGYPWTAPSTPEGARDGQRRCPVAEWLHDEAFVGLDLGGFALDEDQLELIFEAFHKVWAQRESLQRKAA